MDYNMIGTAWSLLPPIVAIALALKTKEVYSSLFIGIILGAVEYCISMGTGLDGFLVHLTNHTVIEGDETKGYGLIHCLSDPWNVGILIFLVLLGSIVSLMNKAGGSAAFGRWASKHVKTKMGVQIATILLGILIFIDDYFNCLTVGSVMRPIAVRNGVTKEKLAYLIDSTAAPVCIISPISSWAAAVSGFVSGGENGLALFCKAIPFNFYAFFTILFMFGIVWLDFDFKAMSKYDARLKEWYERTNGGKLDEVSGTKLHIVEHGVGAKKGEEATASKGSVADLVIPIVLLIIFCMTGMVYSGGYFDATSDNYHHFVDAFAASNASVGLVIGSLGSFILTIILFVSRKTLAFTDAMSSLIKGFEAMVPAILILTLAWTLKSMTDSLGAAEYVSGVVANSAAGLQQLLPAIIFIVAAFLAFATGTSWGTFGILIPICIAVFPAAEPLRIILKPGLASDNLLRMSESVAEHVERLFGGDAVRTGDDSLGDLLGVLERLSSLYERQYPYFREDPKCRLASTARRMSIERMRDMTPEAARWMASHPHEWQRVAPGHGIRMRGANWMPAHALVRTSELSRDLYENRVVAGFPLHLASETRRLAQAFEDAVRVGAGPLDAGTIGRMAAVRIVSSEADVLRGYGIVFSRIAELYRDALGVTPEPVNRLPAPARHFIETSQYRLVYELMREWFELRPVEAETLVSRLASVTSPRLYEYFSLVSLLGGLERRGWTSVEAKRHEYAGAGPLYADNAAAALLNTFIFRKKDGDGGNEEIVRLWYQPVLAAGNVEPENGIGLARTTRWSVRPLNAEAADTLRETDRAWYSPDFLISLESGGRTAWAVMDSKYSTVGTVLRHHAMQQAFKYLTSLGTVRKDDVYAGLWLYCGSVANDRTQEGSFFNASAPDVLPDMVLERVNALSEADPVAGVLERLRTVLAG